MCIRDSLVIEYNKKLVALVYADYEALDSLGLNNPDNLKTIDVYKRQLLYIRNPEKEKWFRHARLPCTWLKITQTFQHPR